MAHAGASAALPKKLGQFAPSTGAALVQLLLQREIRRHARLGQHLHGDIAIPCGAAQIHEPLQVAAHFVGVAEESVEDPQQLGEPADGYAQAVNRFGLAGMFGGGAEAGREDAQPLPRLYLRLTGRILRLHRAAWFHRLPRINNCFP